MEGSAQLGWIEAVGYYDGVGCGGAYCTCVCV